MRNALRALASRVRDDDWIMVHDAARPCFSSADLQLLKRELAAHPVGGLLAVPLADTLKRALEPGAHVTHVDATSIAMACGARRRRRCSVSACCCVRSKRRSTRIACPPTKPRPSNGAASGPRLVAGRADNIKVTTADDLALAAAILSARASQELK